MNHQNKNNIIIMNLMKDNLKITREKGKAYIIILTAKFTKAIGKMEKEKGKAYFMI